MMYACRPIVFGRLARANVALDVLVVGGDGEQGFLMKIPLVREIDLIGFEGIEFRIAAAARRRIPRGIQAEAGHERIQRRPRDGDRRAEAQPLGVCQLQNRIDAGQRIRVVIVDGDGREGSAAVEVWNPELVVLV